MSSLTLYQSDTSKEISVIVVPETLEFEFPVLLEDKVWITKKLGKPKLRERNAKYLAPYWLGEPSQPSERGVHRLYQIIDLIDSEDGKSYEITLGNSFNLIEPWYGLDEAQVRRFQYEPLSKFGFQEIRNGFLVPLLSSELERQNVKISIPEISAQVPVLEPETLVEMPGIQPLVEMPVKMDNIRFFNEFWMGKGINLNRYWKTYYEGSGYIEKFNNSDSYLLEISFANKPKGQPVFCYDPIFKTLKALYFDLKQKLLTTEEFDQEIPLFLQGVNRGSLTIACLGGIMITVLALILAKEKIDGQGLKNTLTEKEIDGQEAKNHNEELQGQINEEKLEKARMEKYQMAIEIMKEHYPELYEKFLKYKAPKEIYEALQNINKEGLVAIRYSLNPVRNGNIDDAENNLRNAI